MDWNIDDLIVHKNKSEWGVGKVLHVNSQEVAIFFVNGGHKTFQQPAHFLSLAPVEMHSHPLLLEVSPASSRGEVRFFPLSECIKRFLRLFPEGFYDPAYLGAVNNTGEREYKVAASEAAKLLLNKSEWQRLATENNYAEICRRMSKIDSRTNLLHSFEKIKWHGALKDAHFQKVIADAFYEDLYGLGSREVKFLTLAETLIGIDGCAKWTIATYYGFLLHPESRIFIKPEVTKFASETCGWDLKYQSDLNWTTLHQAEKMAQYLFDQLNTAGLKPRDFIDIQSFIWCIDPKSYA